MQKEVLVNTAKLLISKLIPALLMTLINVIYSRVLSQSDYGSYQVIWTYLNIFVILTTFGLPKYIITFGNTLDTGNFKKLFKIFLLILLIVLLSVGVYLFVFSNHFDLQARLFFIVLLISQTIYLVQEAYVISDNEGKRLIWSNSLYASLLLGVHLFIYYGIGYSLSYCVFGIALVSISRNAFLWMISTQSVFNKRSKAFQQVADFSLLFWVGVNDSLQILTKWLDKLILLFILPASEYAIYYNGTFELPLIGMALLAFQSIITLYGSKQAGNKEYKLELFRSSSLFMSGIIFPLFAWMFWYATPIVSILFGSKYEESGVLFALTSLFLPMRICSYTVLLQIENKGRVILTGSVIDFVLALLLMLVLYPFLGLYGLVLALIVATYVQSFYYLFKIAKIYSVSLNEVLPFKQLLVRFISSILVLWLIKNLSMDLSPLFSCMIGGVVVFVLLNFYTKLPFIVLNKEI